MAMKDKAMYSVELDKHMMAFLDDMVKQYDLPDSSKALRVLITYALDPETDRDRIFSDQRPEYHALDYRRPESRVTGIPPRSAPPARCPPTTMVLWCGLS